MQNRRTLDLSKRVSWPIQYSLPCSGPCSIKIFHVFATFILEKGKISTFNTGRDVTENYHIYLDSCYTQHLLCHTPVPPKADRYFCKSGRETSCLTLSLEGLAAGGRRVTMAQTGTAIYPSIHPSVSVSVCWKGQAVYRVEDVRGQVLIWLHLTRYVGKTPVHGGGGGGVGVVEGQRMQGAFDGGHYGVV